MYNITEVFMGDSNSELRAKIASWLDLFSDYSLLSVGVRKADITCRYNLVADVVFTPIDSTEPLVDLVLEDFLV